MRVGVDLMGSETSPETLFDSVIEVSRKSGGSVAFVLFATADVASGFLVDKFLSETSRSNHPLPIDLCLVDSFVSMDDDPLVAVRQKKDSSLAQGIRQVRNRLIDAFVTAGNTGALIALSSFHLAPVGAFERPALLAVLPSKDTYLTMIDAGGNVSCKADHLVQYAHVGAAYQRCSQDIEVPRIGLLNIGSESQKGTLELRQAYKILQEQASLSGSKFSFVGNVEGREVFEGKVDVLVTDGFSGNVLLKTSEGISSFIFSFLHEKTQRFDSEELRVAYDAIQRHFNYEEYPGAMVCGVDGLVIKCHGAATKKAMVNSILGAVKLVKQRLLDKIKEQFE